MVALALGLDRRTRSPENLTSGFIPDPAPKAFQLGPFLKKYVPKVIGFVTMALLIGWLMNWSAKRGHPDQPAGFFWGMAHGALMPAALPALIMGQDVTIYAPHNVGRLYKIGYAGGVNVCGFIFFGILFLDLSGKDKDKSRASTQTRATSTRTAS